MKKGVIMLTSLEEIKKDRDLVFSIDWDMTPENAVRVYLEWGNIYARGDSTRVQSKDDHTIYFVVNCWDKPICELKGVYAPEDDLKEWLKKELDVD